MTSNRLSAVLAAASVLVVAALAAWGFAIDHEPAGRWIAIASFLPVLWMFAELAQGGSSDRRHIIIWHRCVIAVAGLLLALRLGPQLALSTQLLESGWEPTLRRLAGIAFGVGLVVWGNYLPKVVSPWRREDEPFDWQRVHRFVGWLAVLGGLFVTGAWLFLPLAQAKPAAMTTIIAVTVLAVGRKLISLASSTHPSPLEPGSRQD